MFYSVTARFKREMAVEFLRHLTDDTIRQQQPDGHEIADSMNRARLGSDGFVRWSEVCYCPTPLAHERKTVLDNVFNDIETEKIEGYVEFEGESFMAYLKREAG